MKIIAMQWNNEKIIELLQRCNNGYCANALANFWRNQLKKLFFEIKLWIPGPTQSSNRLLFVPSHFWPICPVILNFGMHFRPRALPSGRASSYGCAQILTFGPVGPPKCPVRLNLEWALWRTVFYPILNHCEL